MVEGRKKDGGRDGGEESSFISRHQGTERLRDKKTEAQTPRH